jgi:pSer/pThr/pTyr-binding forkhead associated (FHA) protein
VKSGGTYYIRDLASRTHVLVDGRMVKEHTLRDGETLQIGSITLKFKAPAATQVGDEEISPSLSSPILPASLVAAGEMPIPIEDRAVLIGRRPGAEVRLLEASASSSHAVVFEMDGQHYVRDIGSRTGTFVNGVQVHQHRLNPEDVIRVGETSLRYKASPEAVAIPSPVEVPTPQGPRPIPADEAPPAVRPAALAAESVAPPVEDELPPLAPLVVDEAPAAPAGHAPEPLDDFGLHLLPAADEQHAAEQSETDRPEIISRAAAPSPAIEPASDASDEILPGRRGWRAIEPEESASAIPLEDEPAAPLSPAEPPALAPPALGEHVEAEDDDLLELSPLEIASPEVHPIPEPPAVIARADESMIPLEFESSSLEPVAEADHDAPDHGATGPVGFGFDQLDAAISQEADADLLDFAIEAPAETPAETHAETRAETPIESFQPPLLSAAGVAELAAAERAEAERQAAEHARQEREAQRLAAEKAEQERLEAERLAAERAEAERIAAEKAEAERIAAEQAEQERLEAQRHAAEQAEAQRLAAEKAEADRVAAEKAEQERQEAERLAAEKAEADRLAAEKAQAERLAAEKAEQDRLEAERMAAALEDMERVAAEEAERQAAAKAEEERLAAEKAEQERLEAERLATEKAESERIAAEAAERARIESERIAAEQAEAQRLAAEEAERARVEAERLAAENAEQERLEAERVAAEKAEAERIAAEEAERARVEAERLAAEQAQAERLAAEKAEQERIEAERQAAERAEAERLAAEKAEQERLEVERLAAEQAEAERLAAEQAERDRQLAKQREAELAEATRRIEAERIAEEQAAQLEAERQIALALSGEETLEPTDPNPESAFELGLIEDSATASLAGTDGNVPNANLTDQNVMPYFDAAIVSSLSDSSFGRAIEDFAGDQSGMLVEPPIGSQSHLGDRPAIPLIEDARHDQPLLEDHAEPAAEEDLFADLAESTQPATVGESSDQEPIDLDFLDATPEPSVAGPTDLGFSATIAAPPELATEPTDADSLSFDLPPLPPVAPQATFAADEIPASPAPAAEEAPEAELPPESIEPLGSELPAAHAGPVEEELDLSGFEVEGDGSVPFDQPHEAITSFDDWEPLPEAVDDDLHSELHEELHDALPATQAPAVDAPSAKASGNETAGEQAADTEAPDTEAPDTEAPDTEAGAPGVGGAPIFPYAGVQLGGSFDPWGGNQLNYLGGRPVTDQPVSPAPVPPTPTTPAPAAPPPAPSGPFAQQMPATPPKDRTSAEIEAVSAIIDDILVGQARPNRPGATPFSQADRPMPARPLSPQAPLSPQPPMSPRPPQSPSRGPSAAGASPAGPTAPSAPSTQPQSDGKTGGQVGAHSGSSVVAGVVETVTAGITSTASAGAVQEITGVISDLPAGIAAGAAGNVAASISSDVIGRALPATPLPRPPGRPQRRGLADMAQQQAQPAPRLDEQIPAFGTPLPEQSGNAMARKRSANNEALDSLSKPPVHETDVFAHASPSSSEEADAPAETPFADDPLSPGANAGAGLASSAMDSGFAEASPSRRSGRRFGAPSRIPPQGQVPFATPSATGRVDLPVDPFWSGAVAGAAARAANGGGDVPPIGETSDPFAGRGRQPVRTIPPLGKTPRPVKQVRSRIPGFAFAQIETQEELLAQRRRKMRLVPALLGCGLLLAGADAFAIWKWMAPKTVIETRVTYQHLDGLNPAQRATITGHQNLLLAGEDTRHLALTELASTHPELSPGFLSQPDEYKKVADSVSWPDLQNNVMLFSRSTSDPATDALRMKAIGLAVYDNNNVLIGDAQRNQQKLVEAQQVIDDDNRKNADLQKQREEAMAITDGRPDAELISQLRASDDKLKQAWDAAVRAQNAAQAQLQQMQQATTQPTAAGGVSDDQQILQLQTQLDAIHAQVAAAKAKHLQDAQQARAQLDAALAQFQQQVADAKVLTKDNPQLTAYIAAAQKFQETTRGLVDQLIHRQQQQYAQLTELQAQLSQKLQERREQMWQKDDTLQRMNDALEYAKRQLNTAIGSGQQKETDDLNAEIALRETTIKAREDMITVDPILASAVDDVQKIIDEQKRAMEEDRQTTAKALDDAQQEFANSQPAVDQLPADQKSLATQMEARLADLNAARAKYSAAAVGDGSDDETRKLDEQAASIAASIDLHQKRLSDATLASAQQASSQKAIADKQAQLATLTQAANDAQTAYQAKHGELQVALDNLAKANAAGEKLTALSDQQQQLQQQLTELNKDLSFKQEVVAESVQPLQITDADVTQHLGDDVRLNYELKTAIPLFAIFAFFSFLSYRKAAAEVPLTALTAANSDSEGADTFSLPAPANGSGSNGQNGGQNGDHHGDENGTNGDDTLHSLSGTAPEELEEEALDTDEEDPRTADAIAN